MNTATLDRSDGSVRGGRLCFENGRLSKRLFEAPATARCARCYPDDGVAPGVRGSGKAMRAHPGVGS